MPVPAGSPNLSLGRDALNISRIETLEDVIDALKIISQVFVGMGWVAPAFGSDTPYQNVFYYNGDFYGGKPSDPTNPDLLLAAAGGTIVVQEEGTPLTARGIINFIGASVTAADDAGNSRTNITIAGGSSDSFKTIAVSGESDVVADSATDTLTLVAGALTEITTDAGTDTITFASLVKVFRATVNDATHVTSADATFAFDGTTSMLGTAPSSGTATNVFSQAFIDNETVLVFGNGSTYYAMKIQPTIARALVNNSGGVDLADATFGLDGFNAVLGAVPSSGTAVNSLALQLADNQEIIAILKNDGNWFPLRHYETALAKVTTGITGRSGSYTWGSGVVTVLKKTAAGTHSATGGTTGVTVYNSTAQTAAVDDVIQVKRIDGEWFWDVGDCD
jgi:hypothetical protein